MSSITLIRMNNTVWDEDFRISGNLEIPIEEADPGLEKKIKQLQFISLEYLFSSCTRGARETATRIGERLELEVHFLEKLTEFDFGLWQGLLQSEVSVKHYRAYQLWVKSPSQVCPPFGETIGECQFRSLKEVRKILKRFRGKSRLGFVLPPYTKAVLDLHIQQKPLDGLFAMLAQEHAVTSYRSSTI